MRTVAEAVAGRAARLDPPARPGAAAGLREHVAPNLEPGRRGAVRARLQRPLRPHRAAGGQRRDHGRAEGPGPRRPPALHRGLRHAGADRRRAATPAGSARELALAYAVGIGAGRAGHPRDDVQGGDRDRPLRRAGGALRRHRRARPRRVRDARRGGLPARDRVLRVPPRAEADRRPDVGGRPRRTCAGRSPTRPSSATTRAGQRIDRRARARARCRRCSPTSRPARSRASGSPTWTTTRRASSDCAPRRPRPSSRPSARSCAA